MGRASEENLANDDSAFELLGPELLDASLVDGEVSVRNRRTDPPIPLSRDQSGAANNTPAPTNPLNSQSRSTQQGAGGPPVNSTHLSAIQEEEEGGGRQDQSTTRQSTPSVHSTEESGIDMNVHRANAARRGAQALYVAKHNSLVGALKGCISPVDRHVYARLLPM